jgi:diguanylate cyclase (GGDEF)-like protein
MERLDQLRNRIDMKPENFLSITENLGQLSCMIIDIDNFKLINDKYGHKAGDDVLIRIGEYLSSSLLFRKEDICGRYGGEEFLVILPETSRNNALIPAEKLRNLIAHNPVKSGSCQIPVTVSIGISSYQTTDTSFNQMIERADKALYRSKTEGKNRVTLDCQEKPVSL